MATYANLYIDQGADFATNIVVEDVNGDPVDLTNLTLSGQVRRTYQSETAYDFTITKINAAKGELQIRLSDSVTSTMNSGRYVYDVYGNDSQTNNDFKIIEGIAEIVPRVTRSSS